MDSETLQTPLLEAGIEPAIAEMKARALATLHTHIFDYYF